MVIDLDWKSNTISPMSPKLSPPIPPLPLTTLQPTLGSSDISAASSPACAAYDNYLRLPQLTNLWASNHFPNWAHEPILKPALHALEITFRLLATVFSDPRTYVNKREWTRRVESLALSQLHVIAMLCEDEEHDAETHGKAPVIDLNSATGNRRRSYSEESLLPHLATWQKSKDVAQRILASVECEMMRCPYTLGLGEANRAGKPILDYDAVCRPSEVHLLGATPYQRAGSYEQRTVHATDQIVETWIRAGHMVLGRVNESLERGRWERAASEMHAVERIWKVLEEVEEMHVLMDPEDLLRLKSEVGMRWRGETAAFCFRSRGLVEMVKECRDVREKVPEILEVKVDPKGGAVMVEAAMKMYTEKKRERVHVLQAMQGIEMAMKRFFFAYKQIATVVMGSSEANVICSNSLSQIFLEPTYFPSLDAAKTFLGYYWENLINS